MAITAPAGATIGRRGDYFTSVSVGPLFGKMLAGQFAEIWVGWACPNDFVIVEQGAHHGEFATDVLEALRESSPEFFAMLRYRIVEPFPILRQRQQGVLRQFAGKTEWAASLEEMEPFSRRAFFQRAGRCDAGASARRRRRRADGNGMSDWSSELRAASRLCIGRSPIRDCELKSRKFLPHRRRRL